MAEFTPMMQQYLQVKEQYKDAILLYRLGDFYEMFFEDAKTVSRELELVLTGRDCGMEERAPMCGIPFHAAENYIARLVAKGYKVAVCEQMEDPALAKGLVKREVIRIITPGTVTESVMLDETRNNYIASLYLSEPERLGLCFCDVSTGELWVSEIAEKDPAVKAVNELSRFSPAEILMNAASAALPPVKAYVRQFQSLMVSVLPDGSFDPEEAGALIARKFSDTPESLGLADMPGAVSALGCMLRYLYETQKNDLENITEIRVYNESRFLSLNAAARSNLELTLNQRRREKKGSLLWVLDRTKTAMGKRRIRSWVEQPLMSVAEIGRRHNAVEELLSASILRAELTELLSGLCDLERIETRVVYESANAKELRALAQTLLILPRIRKKLAGAKSSLLRDVADGMNDLQDLYRLINDAIVDDPPFQTREGGMIRPGYNAELDSLQKIVRGGRDFIAKKEAEEQEKTGIKKLKIGYNRVFGYYIEVLNTYKALVPDTYIRKQTLSNCERYITPELKEMEARVLGAQERIVRLEYELFSEVRRKTAAEQRRIRAAANAAADLDTLISLATVAELNGYVRPHVDLSGVIDIREGRHPVVEKFLDGAPFVPNDVLMDCGDNRTLIITGPNMAGKSTYMRQVAVIVVMAQMGSFVPAKSAVIGIVDAIFTRVGASDDLSAGESTFMTEMREVASILSEATSDSLIILDEIGRGTSTFDGMSIARAVLEYVNDKKKLGAKTLFATHYHELTDIEQELQGVRNLNTSVKKRGDEITFLRRIVHGPADGSYGVDVAKLAGVPQSVVNRARVILKAMEAEGSVPAPRGAKPAATDDAGPMQLGLFSDVNREVIEALKALDLNTLTPIEALQKLYELKSKAV